MSKSTHPTRTSRLSRAASRQPAERRDEPLDFNAWKAKVVVMRPRDAHALIGWSGWMLLAASIPIAFGLDLAYYQFVLWLDLSSELLFYVDVLVLGVPWALIHYATLSCLAPLAHRRYVSRMRRT